MTFYQFIWWLCLGLAGLSLLLMSTLVVRRVISDRAAARRERRKQAMLEWLLDCLVTLVPEQAGDFIESKRDAKILVDPISCSRCSVQRRCLDASSTHRTMSWVKAPTCSRRDLATGLGHRQTSAKKRRCSQKAVSTHQRKRFDPQHQS